MSETTRTTATMQHCDRTEECGHQLTDGDETHYPECSQIQNTFEMEPDLNSRPRVNPRSRTAAATDKATARFTQGDWQYDDSQRYYSTRVVRMNGVLICNPVHQTTMRQEEYDANVRLITTAPELFAACRAMQDAYERSKSEPSPESAVSVWRSAMSAIDAALAAATKSA